MVFILLSVTLWSTRDWQYVSCHVTKLLWDDFDKLHPESLEFLKYFNNEFKNYKLITIRESSSHQINCPIIGTHFILQQIWWMVWSPLSFGQRRLGAFKLCDTSQLSGEALVVSWSYISKSCRISPIKWHQWQFSCSWIRVLAWSEVNISAIRGKSLSLQDTIGSRG